ncbi:hypothetical protein IQ266_23820 [filamentous cyanobacterium LEGE 11480]|uniref:Uncharacterized protein n=1 Tax=Romeriopsis navalis LEGE 11480 TaxID=2777977 RepID=A0A928VVF2_9CYAN|nr:hypothetical protein [Romeriopsis navalis LEGE 11480]
MRRITPVLIFGTIATSCMFTLFVGSQLQSGRCASITLPLDLQVAFGQTCTVNR